MSQFKPSQINLLFPLFMENTIPSLYSNTIKNSLTQQSFVIPYASLIKQSNNNTFLVNDIPEYLKIKFNHNLKFEIKEITQYKGFMVDLSNYKDHIDYLSKNLSSRNRKNLRVKKRKLEDAQEIRYEFHYGKIDKEYYTYLFNEFYQLLKNRFIEKKTYNKNLVNWQYYYEISFPLIQKKKASLFVIYAKDKPILITLNFHLIDSVFSFIQTYNIDYSHYNLGDISMLKHLEWCSNNDVNIFDLSMGETGYKLKWCNRIYVFKSHLFYRKSSVPSKLIAFIYINKLKLKQYLRNKNIIGKLIRLDKILYRFKSEEMKNYNWKES